MNGKTLPITNVFCAVGGYGTEDEENRIPLFALETGNRLPDLIL